MILTICPNPSIDCTIELDSLNVGKLNRVDNKVETYSGKALNVAVGIARLGEKSLATGFMFDKHARLFEQVLDREGVEHDFVYNSGSARTNYKIIDKRSMLTEINDKGERVMEFKQEELIEKVAKISPDYEIAVMSGSLPKGVDPSFYGKVVEQIPSHVKLILDTEKANMLSALGSREVFMVKPNLRELEEFTGKDIHSLQDMVSASKKYLDRGVKYVLVSLGAEGAVLTDGTDSYFCKSASVAVNSTVGAGDSMVAASCVGISKGVPMQEILRMAAAAGTAAVTTSGTNLFYRDKYNEIYSKIYSERIY
ncbi:MAG: 1-phosphofructokinase family hexose kinase [Clostridiales bacterium]|nr:1-phosphofructokinase family hexose kinase [Clostridiales bacterium]